MEARCQRDRPQRVMGRDGSVKRLGHAGDQTALGDAASMTEVRLQYRRGLLLQDFTKAPLGEDAFAGGDGQMGPAGDIRHDLDLLAVDRFLDEHRLMRLQRLDEQSGGLLAERAMEVDGQVALVADRFAQFGETIGCLIDERLVLH